jgi:hypothetical protein
VTKSKALGASKAQPTFPLPPPKCTCGWIHQADTATAAAATATAANNNAIILHPAKINFAIPKKPLAGTTISDVHHKHTVYKLVCYYDLDVFGFVNGKCPPLPLNSLK